ncbi:hypothetical protein FPV67DRAFT_439223 [Lyophyllum atratum]|nr:hypothetical protein FPV67DRAFT_439223 [Lyophyllum atratum]
MLGMNYWFNSVFGQNSTVELQRDGPALRANALFTWGNYLISQNNQSYVSDTLWPVIESTSFFTTAVQHRAFRQGIA